MKLILDISFIKHLKVKIFPEPAERWADFCWHSADQGISSEQGQSLLQKGVGGRIRKAGADKGTLLLAAGQRRPLNMINVYWTCDVLVVFILRKTQMWWEILRKMQTRWEILTWKVRPLGSNYKNSNLTFQSTLETWLLRVRRCKINYKGKMGIIDYMKFYVSAEGNHNLRDMGEYLPLTF